MNIVSLCYFLVPLMSLISGKVPKKSKIVAIFSEDDVSGKLPKPESVAAEIPKNLILQKSTKLKAPAHNPSKSEAKIKIVETDDDPAMTAQKTKKSKSKSKIKKKDHRRVDEEYFDRKSKNMTDRDQEEDDGEIVEPFIVVESTPITTVTSIIIPTATIVTVTETANLVGENVKIAKIEATSRPQSDETFTPPPQKIRQFTPRSRMNVKRASSSAYRHVLLDFKVISAISFVALFIINI